MGYIALIIATGFTIIYFGKLRNKNGGFGNKVWWNNLRPIHAMLYYVFAYMAIKNIPNAYLPLFIDVVVGFMSFILYRLGYNWGS